MASIWFLSLILSFEKFYLESHKITFSRLKNAKKTSKTLFIFNIKFFTMLNKKMDFKFCGNKHMQKIDGLKH